MSQPKHFQHYMLKEVYEQPLAVSETAKEKDVATRVAATIDDAVEYAMNAADPDPGEAATDLYA